MERQRGGRRRCVLVVAYHSADLLRGCLEGLDPDERVIVVDNSADHTVRAVAHEFGVEYLDTGNNLGFAGGVNFGLAHLGGPIALYCDILLLNPDAVVSSATVDALQLEFCRVGNERLAAAAPQQRQLRGQYCQRVHWPFPSPLRQLLNAIGLGKGPGATAFLVGSVLLLRREALAELGGLDERYFLYSEETDWQRRAVLRGWRLAFVDGVVAEHVGGGTSSNSLFRETLQQAGQETYIRRWYGPAGWQAFRWAVVVGWGLRGVLYRTERGREARFLAGLYLAGPRRRAQITSERAHHPTVVHVVTDAASHSRQHEVAMVAAQQAADGADVTLVGASAVGKVSPAVRRLPGSRALDAARSLLQCGSVASVVAHDVTASRATRWTRSLLGSPTVTKE